MAHTDPEIELYRNLMDQPDEFVDGFGTKAVLGSLFVGFVMMPGAIYLGLMAGQTLGPAAEWTTIILFTEIARRSYVSMSRAEVYILYYIAASLASMEGGLALAGGAFAGSMWMQYFVRSPAAKGMGIASRVPTWVVPPADSPALAQRTFLHEHWVIPIVLTVVGRLLGRMVWFGMGYSMFRITSDYENLPFPFAAITAQGATALAEASSKEETWRWRTFSIGAMIGLVFGVIYLGIPTITGVIMTEPVQLIPIPWVDLTRTTESVLPAVPMGFMTNLGEIISGFVVPFWAVVGSFIAAVGMAIVNPMLFKAGILHTWRPGMDTINTMFYNQIDFYFSVGIGASLAVAVMGFYEIYRKWRYDRQARERGEVTRGGWVVPKGRGDLPLWIPIGVYAVAALAYVVLCAILVPNFPVFIIAGFAFLISPFESYINARMIGMTGQFLGVPMVREATIIFSGYRGVDIWFAPIPRFNVGGAAQEFRVLELTGNKIISLVKAELIMLPISILCSLLFWQFIWRLAPVPSSYYPYAQKMWPLSALQQGLWLTSTVNPETSVFYKAWNESFAIGGFVVALGLYAGLSALRLPILLIYGVVRGFGILPHSVIPQMIGALISQFYFIPRFGARRWKLYATVLAAGFACGMGLIGMGTIALALIGKAVSQMPY